MNYLTKTRSQETYKKQKEKRITKAKVAKHLISPERERKREREMQMIKG